MPFTDLITKKLKTVFLILLFSSIGHSIFAATITSAATGNWNAGATWVGGVVPATTDNATIAAGHIVTLTASTSIVDLNLNATNSKLILNTGQTLTVTGTFANIGTTTNGVNGPGTILFTGTTGFGVLTATGTRPNVTIGDGASANTITIGAATLIADLTINGNATFSNNTSNFTVGISGNLIVNSGSTFTTGTGVYTLSGAGKSIQGTAVSVSIPSIAVTGTYTFGGSVVTLTVSTALSGAGTFTMAVNTTLYLTGTTTVTTLTATANPNTVVYNGAAQTVKVTTYYHLNLSGSGAKTCAVTTINGNMTLSGTATISTGANLAISGNLVIGDGTTFTSAGFTLGVTGTTTVGGGTSGILTSTTTNVKTFTGLVTINSGGTFTSTQAATGTVVFRNGITNNGGNNSTSFACGGATFNTNAQALNGNTTINFSGVVTVTTITLTNNITVNMTSVAGPALTGSGTWLQANGSTLNFSGASMSSLTLNASTASNIVDYNRGGAQTIYTATYYHLILSTSGTKTLAAASTVNGNFTVSAGTFNDDNKVLTVKGNVVMTGTHVTATNSATAVGNITLSGGSGIHTLSGAGSYHSLKMNDASFGATLGSNISLSGVLTLTDHNITLGAFDLSLTSGNPISGGSASSYIITDGAGMLKRTIDTYGTYSFPMGSATAYNGASLVWYATPGVTRVDGKYTATTVSAGSGLPFASSSCLTVSALLDNGYWTFTETGTISANYDLTLTRNGETNASTALQDHAIVRRNSSATAWTDPGTWAVTSAAVTTASGQISPVPHTGVNAFGEFAIAKGTNSAPVVAAIAGGVTAACLNATSGTAFTDATGGGVWSITSGTGNATIDASGYITGTAQGTVTVNYSITSGGDCTTTATSTGTTVYDGGTITPASYTKCHGSTTTIAVSGYTGTLQWQDNVSGAGWVNGTGTNPTSVTYTTPTLNYPNSYQFRMLAQGACLSLNTVTITPLETAPAAPGVPTTYDFISPRVALAKSKALCPDNYTFTQGLPSANANIAIGETVTVTFMAGTNATTMTSGTFAGTAIDMGTTTTTATTVTFLTPVAVTAAACPAAPSSFTIILNGITNPGYNLSGNATVSVDNNATGAGGLDNGTYPYSTANHLGDFYDYNMATAWDYTVQNSLGHCYNNLAAGTYCFEYINPTSGTVRIGTIANAGTSGCSPSTSGPGTGSAAGSCVSAGSATGQLLFDAACNTDVFTGMAGTACTNVTVSPFTLCFTVPAGCDGENFCPLIDCSGICGGGPLPIELLYFDATLNGGVVELSWATATETNNDFFTVEKTIDGNVYFDFLKVDGAGNSTTVQHYNTVDERPFSGLSYYRLMQTDYDGKFAYSKLVPINTDPFAKLAVKYVFGNKDNNNLQYQLSSANNNPISVTVFDVMGKTVLTERIASSPDGQTLYMNASSLSKGVYILRVFDGENVAVKKFVY